MKGTMTERGAGVWRLRALTGYTPEGNPIQRSWIVHGAGTALAAPLTTGFGSAGCEPAGPQPGRGWPCAPQTSEKGGGSASFRFTDGPGDAPADSGGVARKRRDTYVSVAPLDARHNRL